MMPVTFNPNTSATPNVAKNAGADDAPASVSPNHTFAQLLSTASGAHPKAVAARSADHQDAKPETDDEPTTDVAATATVPPPWLPLGMTLSLATDVAVETGVAAEALRRDGAVRANALATVPMDAAGAAVSPGIEVPSDATAAARTPTVRPAVEGAGGNRKADAQAPVTPFADRLGGKTPGDVNAASTVAATVGNDPPGARPLPAAPSGEAIPLRTVTARPYTEVLPAAAVTLQLPPDVARGVASETRKTTLDAIPGSMLPLTATGTAPPPAVIAIETPVKAPGWSAEVAQKVAQVILFRNETAEIHVNPPQLGPVDVRISFASDQPTLLITAPDPATRGALEQALPHLRDLLAQHGITLGQTSVQGDRQSPHAFAQPPRDPTVGAAGTVNALGDVAPRTARADWLVDLYA